MVQYTYISRLNASKPFKVLLAGASGYLGRHLRAHFENLGFHVICATRETNRLAFESHSITYTQIEDLGIPDCDFVVNVTGSPVSNGEWTTELKNGIEDSRIYVTRMLANAIRNSQTKPYSFVSASCTGYYPRSATTDYTEEFKLPPTPTRDELLLPEIQTQEISLPYFSRLARAWEGASSLVDAGELENMDMDEMHAQRKERIEAGIRSSTSVGGGGMNDEVNKVFTSRYEKLFNHDVRVVNMRMGAIVGQHSQLMNIYKKMAAAGLMNKVMDGTQIMPWVHIDDLCRMFEVAMTNNGMCGALNCVTPEYTTNEQMTNVGKKHFSYWSWPVELTEERVEREIGIVRAPLVTESLRVQPTKLLDLGFDWKYPTAQSLMQDLRSDLEKESSQW